MLGTQKVDTYNVYDDYGQVVAVLPPGSLDDNTGVVTDHLIFWYKYDNQNRLIEKKVPGADSQKFYYDNRDLVTLAQDGNMRNANYSDNVHKHIGTEYDALGRVVKTGFVITSDPLNHAKSGFTIAEGSNKLSEIQYYPNKSWVKHRGTKFLETHNPNQYLRQKWD